MRISLRCETDRQGAHETEMFIQNACVLFELTARKNPSSRRPPHSAFTNFQSYHKITFLGLALSCLVYSDKYRSDV